MEVHALVWECSHQGRGFCACAVSTVPVHTDDVRGCQSYSAQAILFCMVLALHPNEPPLACTVLLP